MKKYVLILLFFMFALPARAQLASLLDDDEEESESAESEPYSFDEEDLDISDAKGDAVATAENDEPAKNEVSVADAKADENNDKAENENKAEKVAAADEAQNKEEEQNKDETQTAPEETSETEREAEDEQEEYAPNPSNFSADFMVNLYQCLPVKERQNLSGFEEIAVIGKVNGKCRLRYDDFVLNISTELLPNIHSMADIRRLLLNQDIAQYQPRYEYAGLLLELNLCSKSVNGHNAYLHRRNNNDISITTGLTSKVENGGCTIRLLNQLSMNDSFVDYSVVCRIPANDMQLILETYADLLQEPNPDEAKLKKADEEIMFRLQQVGYCQKPKLP